MPHSAQMFTFWHMFTDLAWPEEEEALSPAAQDAIETILTTDQDIRPRAQGRTFFEIV